MASPPSSVGASVITPWCMVLAGSRRRCACGQWPACWSTCRRTHEVGPHTPGTPAVAMVKAGVELAFETMTAAGIIADSAYYESLHETPLIANTIARKKLYEMNATISDTAEYGCYLYNHACLPLLADFMKGIDTDVIGRGLASDDNGVDNARLIEVNAALRDHPVEAIGATLRSHMADMKKIV